VSKKGMTTSFSSVLGWTRNESVNQSYRRVVDFVDGARTLTSSSLFRYSIFNNGDSLYEMRASRWLAVESSKPKRGGGPLLSSLTEAKRRLGGDQQAACDSSFLQCLPDFNCVDCFATLESEGIDWTGVTPDLPCFDVVQFLLGGGHCTALEGEKDSIDTFCGTFEACVVWSDESGDDGDDQFIPDEAWVNCTALTECDWPGMKQSWLGDGMCNDNMHGCYNTALCRYDGGDCCKDTCVGTDSEFKNCGNEGYKCRDPNSDECNSDLTNKCKKIAPDADNVRCAEDETKYRLNMYDSFGDGWDTTMLTIKSTEGQKQEVFRGQLADGSEGIAYICLSKSATCYNVETTGGIWGIEVSWAINPSREGLPSGEFSCANKIYFG
jgi:hypothetical protein